MLKFELKNMIFKLKFFLTNKNKKPIINIFLHDLFSKRIHFKIKNIKVAVWHFVNDAKMNLKRSIHCLTVQSKSNSHSGNN